MSKITKPISSQKTRQRRSDSAAAAVKAMANVQAGELKPPAGVAFPVEARKFWTRVVANRARDRWNELDLTNAVELCRMFADIERFRALIVKEGDVVKGKVHPAHKLLEAAGRRAISLARVLHVHPEATEGRARDGGNALNLERQSRTATRAHDDDGLIPGLLQ
jgi:phage terminase small subunit